MAKSDKTERRAAVDQIRSQQRRADRRQGMVIVGACLVLSLGIVGAAAYSPVKDWWDQRTYESKELSDIGAPVSSCQPIFTKKATGEQSHVQPGTPVPYPDAPPAFGQHESVPEPMAGKFYDKQDRPNVEKLVHNLEHGYTILWYDESVAGDDDQMTQLRAIAKKLGSTSNLRDKFKIAPWLKTDGKPFPDGEHVALTHWARESKEKGDKNDPNASWGVWQYCSAVSGEALNDFMVRYDYTNSPEPVGM